MLGQTDRQIVGKWWNKPVERPRINVQELKHETDCGVNDLTFREHAGPSDCTCGACVRWYESVLQAVFDPENQPSQFGTQHLATLDAAWEKINALGGTVGEYDDFGRGINHAVEQATGIIEDIGGMDPLKRKQGADAICR